MGAPYIYDISRLRVKDLHSATYIYVVRRLRVKGLYSATTITVKSSLFSYGINHVFWYNCRRFGRPCSLQHVETWYKQSSGLKQLFITFFLDNSADVY